MVFVEGASEEAVQDMRSSPSVCSIEQDSVVMVQETWGLDRIDQVDIRDDDRVRSNFIT
jgi:hypothetical protein